MREGRVLKKDVGEVSTLRARDVMDMSGDNNFMFYYLCKKDEEEVLKVDAAGGSSACKKPAMMDNRPVYSCPLEKCVCEGCPGSLIYHISADATCYDLGGPRQIAHQQKNCTSRKC